ncbi:transcriptional repressor [bacterium]|nr:transcriptional repressor [bacterium]
MVKRDFPLMPQKRNTKQKELVWMTIQKAKKPLSVPELLESLLTIKSTVNKTTVYRILEQLVQEGKLSQFTSPDRVTHYELHSGHSGQHSHFVCESCGDVTCLPETKERSKVDVPKGFKVHFVQSIVLGTCRMCA